MPVPTCPEDCTTPLAPVKFSDCAPEIILSEIRRIFVAKPTATAFTDVSQATEWTSRISETDVASDDAIRPLTVIADKPAAAAVVKEISNGRRFNIGKDHTLNITIDDVSPENYEFMRVAECGGKFKMWYETAGGFLYGGNEGILVDITLDDVLNRGLDEIETIAGTATWRAKFHPDRVLSPIFNAGVITPPEEGV